MKMLAKVCLFVTHFIWLKKSRETHVLGSSAWQTFNKTGIWQSRILLRVLLTCIIMAWRHKSSMTGELLLRQGFSLYNPPFGGQRWANIQTECRFFRFMLNGCQNRCWCRSRHNGVHLFGVAVRDTNRRAPEGRNSCCVLQWFKCPMLVSKDCHSNLL